MGLGKFHQYYYYYQEMKNTGIGVICSELIYLLGHI